MSDAPPIVECIYEDVWFDTEDSEPASWPKVYLMHIVGFLVHDDPDVMHIAAEIGQDGQYRAVTHIPSKLIVSRKQLSNDGEGVN